MPNRLKHFSLGLCIAASLIVIGCGGGGDSSLGGVTAGATAGNGSPSPKTKADVSAHLFATGQSAVSTSFAAYGPKFQVAGGEFFDVPLGLWAHVRVSPAGTTESFYMDQANTQAAGGITYQTNQQTLTISGPITVTSGRYSGLSGTYSQAVQSGGFNGTINYGIAGVSTVVDHFADQSGAGGKVSGTATIGVTLHSGYTQNQQVIHNADGSMKITGTDGNGCNSVLNFVADASGSGTITGSDPGLPATVSWDANGSGQIKYADGSTAAVTNWNTSG